jgi:hypothetical protein
MSFKYFRHTLRKVNTTQKAPAAKNTASAERFSDLIDGSDILTNNSVDQHLADINFDDHGHSILKESGLTRGHSILENSFSDQLAGHDSILGGAGKQNESQFGEDGLRSAGAFGKGMAASDGDEPQIVVENSDGTTQTAPANAPITGDVDSPLVGVIAGALTGAAGDVIAKAATVSTVAPGLVTAVVVGAVIGGLVSYTADAVETLTPPGGTEGVVNGMFEGTAFDASQPGHNYSQRPGVDDNNGGEGGFMTWKQQDQLSNGLNNVKDPITNPNGDDLGSNYLTDADLIQMEADLRNAKDPATNWGEDTYNNFMGAVEMNVGEISLKAPATNWGDNDTPNSDNVVDTLFTVQNDF